MAKQGAGWSRAAARSLMARRLAMQWVAPPLPALRAGDDPESRTETGVGAERIRRVVGRMLAVQAQDFGQAVWALGVRSAGSTLRDVEAALDAGAVVRSWPMRGTLHFSTPDDLRLMLSITAARTIRSIMPRYRELGLTEEIHARARELALAELGGGGRASRDEFFALLSADGIDPGGQRGTHVIGRLAHDGVVCWGPTAAGRQQLVLFDEWTPPGPGAAVSQGAADAAADDPRRDAALGEFVLKYLAGHGPATLKDFCWWSKVTVADAQRGLAAIRDRLSLEHINDTEYWTVAARGEAADEAPAAEADDRAGSEAGGRAGREGDGQTGSEAGGAPEAGAAGVDVAEGTAGKAAAFLALPGFDEFLLGYPERVPAVAAEYAQRIVPGNNGVFLPMLVAHGTVVGTWRRRITPAGVTVTTVPFEPLSANARAGFARALRSYARFLDLPLTLKDGDDG
ncbi:winged helix DNA-binding domain-containing protein [Herbiconiux sp. P15]|uniref:winged helix DNA-binding domain-containing protein n=1 Tax=Herbiconiux liukaitaii TaxID=3342799 RepID=UPI0035BAA2B4